MNRSSSDALLCNKTTVMWLSTDRIRKSQLIVAGDINGPDINLN